MDTDLIRIFLTYSETQNFRVTAEFHNISHVAVIRSIKRLEQILGGKLSIRIGRGSKLTLLGKNIVDSSKKLIHEEDQFLNSVKGKQQKSNFKIATFEVFSTHLAPEINASLGPQVPVLWFERIPGAIEQTIKSNVADIGITYLPIPTDEVEHLKVCSIQMNVFQASSLPFNHYSFEKIPFVIPLQEQYTTPTKAKGLDGWPDDLIPRNVLYQTTLLESALSMVSAGQCIGYFPNFIVDLYNRNRAGNVLKILKIAPLNIKQKQDVYLVKRKNEEEDFRSKRVVKVLLSLSKY